VITEHSGSLFFYLKHLVRAIEIVDEQIGVLGILLSSLIYYSILSTVNLFTSNWGTQFTSHSIQNPVYEYSY